MMSRIRIRPAVAGNIVRDPRNMQPIPAAGVEVLESTYWRRRLLAGDVVEVKEESPKRAASAAQPQPQPAKNKSKSSSPNKEGDE